MKTLAHYLIVFFSFMIFIFRLIVAFTTIMGIKFIVQATNPVLEMIYVVSVLVSAILMSKSKLSGAIIFLVGSTAYLGPTLISQLMQFSTINIDVNAGAEIFANLICLIISLFSFVIVALAKKQERKPVDKKTDFFYKNEAYDRNMDDRADKNNYRIY